MTRLDETHAPDLRSWVESAQHDDTDFPIQNLPFGIFKRVDANDRARVGVAIGDQIVDVAAFAKAGVLDGEAALVAERCAGPSLNALMELGRGGARTLRRALSSALRTDTPSHEREAASRLLVPMSDAGLQLPVRGGDYTDFFSYIRHSKNYDRII